MSVKQLRPPHGWPFLLPNLSKFIEFQEKNDNQVNCAHRLPLVLIEIERTPAEEGERVTRWLFLFIFLTLLEAALPQASAARLLSEDTGACLNCHGDKIDRDGFAASVHGRNGCTSCHAVTADLAKHAAGEASVAEVNCVPCHKQEAAQHFSSVHMLAGVTCVDCHDKIHRQRAWQGNKMTAVSICLKCHADNGYLRSVHGRAVAGGNADAAACHDCHNLHAVNKVTGPNPNSLRALHIEMCIPCHNDREKMARNRVVVGAVSSFINSYHGKSYRLGFPEQTAGCSDCHRAHLVLPQNDPDSSLNPAHLVQTCAQCHPKATPLFVQYYAHADYRDPEHYPLLFWTYVSMTGLLVTVFSVFWLHSLLWMFRGFVENREKLAAEARGEGRVIRFGKKPYRRFAKHHIFFHLLVIISFLGLSVTGLPLKFSNQEWAKAIMSFFGGVQYAGLLHRAFAVITFYYFLAALLMSINYLFISKDFPGNWRQRLFGPDSLLPNVRDSQDIGKMARWFFFLGPKPTFERWTYWEKFDFLAVFWGMLAIGSSGLMLWFPEFFGRFLPGWMFNIATIIHSDEALLATGFIFTVHFFNTHGRPEKFPMDFVIFNGQLTKEEFIEERGDQWRRYQQAGISEKFAVKKPSGIAYDFFFKGFGFMAVLTGLLLAFLMIYAFIRG